MLHLTGPGETQTVVRPGLAEPRAFERRGLAGPLSSSKGGLKHPKRRRSKQGQQVDKHRGRCLEGR